ncbi:hypothetical protein EJD97_008002 [Solanum chilense]|uniref:Glycine-rich protein n=1 Tax=Solanum chilense TaxID=4083 RepID=A0A6N2BQV1_SOLCI|nr:hypothetical protein EJD97_008002 [Solanum chilense]
MKLLCFNMRKLLVFMLIIIMFCSCLGDAYPRKALIGGEKLEEHVMGYGVGFGARKKYIYPDRDVDNHHNIPREYFGQRGDNSSSDSGGAGDNSDNGRG